MLIKVLPILAFGLRPGGGMVNPRLSFPYCLYLPAEERGLFLHVLIHLILTEHLCTGLFYQDFTFVLTIRNCPFIKLHDYLIFFNEIFH